MDKAFIKNILKNIKSDTTLTQEIKLVLRELDARDDKLLDLLLVQSFNDFRDRFRHPENFPLPEAAAADKFSNVSGNISWRWYWWDIINGKYPLQKLPLYAQDFARVLYYIVQWDL